jgi:hypothetical protein
MTEGKTKDIVNWKNPSTASPVFIIGCQRSGTTLLRTILHAHSDISIGYECAFYKVLADKYFYGQCPISENLSEFIDDLYGVKRFNLWNLEKEFLYQKFLEIDVEKIDFSQAVLYIGEIYRQQNKPNASLIGFKNPNGIFHVPLIFQLYPSARVIHILRDVRGIYASEKKKRSKKETYDSAYHLWKVSQRYKRAVKTFDEFSGDSRVYTLLYSDLVQELEKTIAELLAWLNVSWDSKTLSYSQENKANEFTPEEELWQHGKTLEKPDISRVSAFYSELSSRELKAMELLCKHEIKRFSGDATLNFASVQGIPLVLESFNKRIKERLFKSK